MGFHDGLRSMSGKTMLFVALAAAYYVALNAVLIHEIIDRVRTGTSDPAATRSHSSLVTPDPRDPSTSCGDHGRMDRGICKAELLAGKVSARFKERVGEARRERRAARDERRRTAALPAVADASHREIAAIAR
jgi:hypothetical protein